MKKTGLIFFVLFLAALIFVFACSKKSNPAEPGINTPTFTTTACVACTSTDTPTITQTNTVTPTITVTTVSSHYNFENASLDGWATGGWGGASNCGAVSASVVSAPTPYSAGSPHAVKLDYNLTTSCDQALLTLTLTQPGYLVGKAIVVHVWIPAGLIGTGTQYGANIGLTGSLGEKSGTPVLFTAGGWQQLYWAPSGDGENAVSKITIMIGKAPAAPDVSGTLYIDEIVWF